MCMFMRAYEEWDFICYSKAFQLEVSHAGGFRGVRAGWDPTCIQFNMSRRHACVRASNVIETKMLPIERGD